VTSEDPAAPRDERAILDELERLHHAIQSTRRQRQQKVEEFDAFVNTFRGPRMVERLAAVEAMEAAASVRAIPPAESASPIVQPFPLPPPRNRSAREDAAAPADSSAPRLAPLPSDAVLRELRQKVDTDDPQEVIQELQRRVARSEPSTPTPRRQTKLPPRVLAIVAAAIALAIFLVTLWRPWQRSPSAGARTSPLPASATQPGSATPAAPGTTAPPTPRAVALELTAARAVWMRIVVDGKNVLEREVAAGEVLTFGGNESVVVRAGDAGSVRVKQNGADLGPLGKEGFPTTRTFSPDAGRD